MQGVQEGKKWTIINDVVYDMTFYIKDHPGGQKVLEDITGMKYMDIFNIHHVCLSPERLDQTRWLWCKFYMSIRVFDFPGMDGTDSFLEVHGGDRKVLKILQGLTVGDLNDSIGILDTEEEQQQVSRAVSKQTCIQKEGMTSG